MPRETSRSLCHQAATLGFASLLAEHAALWHSAGIVRYPNRGRCRRPAGAPFQHVPPARHRPHPHRARLDPGARHVGPDVQGRDFWDTEIFMLPFFNHAFPALARNLLLYRYHTLDGARRKAREYGYRGAFYAWESQDTGDDACTLSTSPMCSPTAPCAPTSVTSRSTSAPISPTPFGNTTPSPEMPPSGGWRCGSGFRVRPLLPVCTYYSPDKRRYEILDVTGPDEYHERVHNNAFTNRLVAHTFEICLRVAELLRTNSPNFWENGGCLGFDMTWHSSPKSPPTFTSRINLTRSYDPAIRRLFLPRKYPVEDPVGAQTPSPRIPRWRERTRHNNPNYQTGRRGADDVPIQRALPARNQIRQLGILRTAHRTRLQPERLLLLAHRRPNRQSETGPTNTS